MTARGAAVELAARRTALRQTAVPACAILSCLLVAVGAPAEIRAPVVIFFLCVVPGLALVGLLSPDSLELELALAVALSVALSGLIALGLVYAHLWSPTAVVLIAAAVTLAGGLRDVERGRFVRAWRWFARVVSAATAAGARFVRRRAARLPAAAAALLELPARVQLPRPASGRVREMVTARSSQPTEASQTGLGTPPVASESSLQSFLLDELRSARSQGSRRRRPPESLAGLEPRELEELLSWSSLQRFVTRRAVGQLDPELWFVDDLERRLRRPPAARRATSARTVNGVPRGVWITAVSRSRSIPVAWRVLGHEEAKEWRARLALEALDAVSELGSRGAVVAAGATHGSLSGFRRGLEDRGLSYLLRVDAVTAARELAPDTPSRSAGEAREVVRDRLTDGTAIPAGPQPNGARPKSELVLLNGVERLVLCELAADGQVRAFWLSNLQAETTPGHLAYLLRLADRHRVERSADDPLLGALEVQVENEEELQRQLAGIALAHGLRTLGLSAAAQGPAER